jgi:hypothetical protein
MIKSLTRYVGNSKYLLPVKYAQISAYIWSKQRNIYLQSDFSLKFTLQFNSRGKKRILGSNRIPQDPTGSIRIHQDPPGSIRIHQDPIGSHRIHQDPLGSIRIHPTVIKRMYGSLDPDGSCWILLDPHGSCWLLLDPVGSSWILLDPDGSWWLLMAPVGS